MSKTKLADKDHLEITAGMEFEIKVLEWREYGWEFDHPVVIIEPVRRYSPNGDSAEHLIEELCIDAVCDGWLRRAHPNDIKEFEGRGWSWDKLAVLYEDVVAGRPIPKKGFRAHSSHVRIFDSPTGLNFVYSDIQEFPAPDSRKTPRGDNIL